MTRILILEDEAIIALYLAQELTEAGYEVMGPLASTEEALRLINPGGCDGALLDVDLGTETSEVVAIWLAERGIPFVGLSGYAEDSRPAGFKGVPMLKKPVEIKQLFKELGSW